MIVGKPLTWPAMDLWFTISFVYVVVELFLEITTQQGMYKHSGEEHSMVQIDYVHPHYHVVPVLRWE